MTVDGIDYYIADAFGEGLYDSCKDVKFGTMNSRALEFIGAGAKNFRGNLILLNSQTKVASPSLYLSSLYPLMLRSLSSSLFYYVRKAKKKNW